jgi:hypothetical protein
MLSDRFCDLRDLVDKNRNETMGFAELNPSYGDGPICRGDRRVLFLRPLRSLRLKESCFLILPSEGAMSAGG